MDVTVNNIAPILRNLSHSHNIENFYFNANTSQNPTNHPQLVRDVVFLTLQQKHSVIYKEVTAIETTTKYIQPFLKFLHPHGLNVFISLVRDIVAYTQ